MRRRSNWPFGPRVGGGGTAVWIWDPGSREPGRSVSGLHDGWGAPAPLDEGQSVLDDLAECGDDGATAARVLARYFALHLLLRSRRPGFDRASYEAERHGARAYLAASAATSPSQETRSLWALLRTDRPLAHQDLPALLDVGWHALRRHHRAGAVAYFRTAYTLALDDGEPAIAARAASALATLAQGAGSAWAARLWHRRAAVLQRRADAAEAAQSDPGAAEASPEGGGPQPETAGPNPAAAAPGPMVAGLGLPRPAADQGGAGAAPGGETRA